MNCAILIIGSLLWDAKSAGRECWRQRRLNVSSKVLVRAPIHYGRKSSSRNDTYTMTFGIGEPLGRAALVPCVNEVNAIDDLIQEARALWKAESSRSEDETICSDWGCVVAMFGARKEAQQLAKNWATYFSCKTCADIQVVKSDGTLNVPWPNTLDGKPADFDVILATATKPEAKPPSAQDVADAWVKQSGFEEYFFNNVKHGIRTPDDGDIWLRIKESSPCWLEKKKQEYEQAIEILRAEIANGAQG